MKKVQSVAVNLMHQLSLHRGMGTTTSLVGVLMQNKNACMLVGSYSEKMNLIKQYRNLKSPDTRIITVDEFISGKLRGTHIGPILLDTSVISRIILDEQSILDKENSKSTLYESVKKVMEELNKIVMEVKE